VCPALQERQEGEIRLAWLAIKIVPRRIGHTFRKHQHQATFSRLDGCQEPARREKHLFTRSDTSDVTMKSSNYKMGRTKKEGGTSLARDY
jgi:hypothetical protein